MLNEREVKILEMLLTGEELTINKVSEYFGVSKRSIQYDINKINYYLLKNQNSKILIKDSKFIFDIEAITNILLENDKSNDLIKDDRIDLIYLNSIFNLTGLNISSLSKIIGVSRNTIKSDMESMNEKFEYINSKGYYILKICLPLMCRWSLLFMFMKKVYNCHIYFSRYTIPYRSENNVK